MHYDHSKHAGNAGDVFKHMLLAGVAGYMLQRGLLGCGRVYAESHCGAPFYTLMAGGEWEGGIGRLWSRRDDLLQLDYFMIMSRLNGSSLSVYPGSASIVLQEAKARFVPICAHLWDCSRSVAHAWDCVDGSREQSAAFHLGDGFCGVSGLIQKTSPGLLLIDPPYTGSQDVGRSEELFYRAVKCGWTVLCWFMTGTNLQPDMQCPHSVYEIVFSRAGMDGGRFKGAAVAVGGADHYLKEHIELQIHRLFEILSTGSGHKV